MTDFRSSTGPARLVALVDRLAPSLGRNLTGWAGLRAFRSDRPTVPDPAVYTPAICIVAQGAKEASLGELTFRYDPLQYLVIGAPLPVRARVTDASRETPFLSIILDVGTADVRDLLVEMADVGSPSTWQGGPPLRVSPLDERLLDAINRFLAAVIDPVEQRVLAPGLWREVLFLALQRDQGDLLRLAAQRDPRSPAVARALHYLHHHLDQHLDVPTLAREVGMSVSTLHHRFRDATSMSPIQYLKRIRLDSARQLMLDEGCQAAEAAYRVGYESPSQFSREFKRLFGLPPRQYLDRAVGA